EYGHAVYSLRGLAFLAVHDNHVRASAGLGDVGGVLAVGAENWAAIADALVLFAFLTIHHHKSLVTCRSCKADMLSIRAESQAEDALIGLGFLFGLLGSHVFHYYQLFALTRCNIAYP